jgi:hydrogenase/urease accessory protein HupE
MSRRAECGRAATLAIFLCMAFVSAEAHTVGISRGAYRVSGADVQMDLVFARPELAGSIQGIDADHDGTISASELLAGRAAIESFFIRGIEVKAQPGTCAGIIESVALVEEDGISINAAYHCSGPSAAVIDLKFLRALSTGHRHLTAVGGSANTHGVAYAGNTAFSIPFQAVSVAKASVWGKVWPLFLLGIQHILTGYDHLIFLLGLILVGGRIRQLLLVITAFTLAHSITLGVSALQIWSPSTRFVEPAIALSIAYIGIENWFVHDASRRWMITFPFGLIHGFGFAGALRQIALPHSEMPIALLSFNLGVEAGQLSVLAVVLPLIVLLRRRRWFVDRGVKTLSAAVALAGLCWFAIRIQ